MARGMHKGPRSTRFVKSTSVKDVDGELVSLKRRNWASKVEVEDDRKRPGNNLERRILDFHATENTNSVGSGLLRHRPGSNKK